MHPQRSSEDDKPGIDRAAWATLTQEIERNISTLLGGPVGVGMPVTASTARSPTITLESLKESMELFKALEKPKPATPMELVLAGRWMPTDSMCARLVPARTLKQKTWHRNRCYYLRVSKKWLKKYGKKPAMDKDTILLDGINDIVHLHTESVKKIAEKAGVPYMHVILAQSQPLFRPLKTMWPFRL